MTKNIRKEILFELSSVAYFPSDWQVDNLINLFRSWALGCVGEDAPGGNVMMTKESQIHAIGYDKGYNQAKQEIRKKIEEVGE